MENTENGTVKSRLIHYLEAIGMSKVEFGRRIGVSSAYITSMRKSIQPDKIERIKENFPNLDIQWLLTGAGEMEKVNVVPVVESTLEDWTTTKAGTKFYKREDGQIVMKVPIVPIAALGSPDDEWGKLIEDFDGDTTTVTVDAVHHGKYIAFRVQGDSMDDGSRQSFEAGDIVVVRELDRDKWLPKLHIRQWPFWVIVFGNNVRIKQIIAQDENTGAITLHSLNTSPEFTDFTLELDQVHRLFNVIKKVPKEIIFGT